MARGGSRLATERPDVVLEPWGKHHKDGLRHAADDERISRHMTDQFPYPYTEQDANEWIAICEAQDPVLSFATLVEGVVAGGLGSAPRDDVWSGSAEIGWWLSPPYWNQGITSAAVRRYIRYCFEDLDLHRVDAGVFQTNLASTRVAEKVGLRFEGVAVDGYLKNGELTDRLQFGLARRDWESS
ncbi:MAG: GNAT family protein [Acidimicrobiia bacterium]|nr:MAG: GNAT family protein [Acidimicrobiia bacterium]